MNGGEAVKGETEQVLDFVNQTGFDDISAAAVHETKRIFLDSIGVGMAALKTDKGRYAMALAKRFGGPPESAILGTRDRVSCGNAAFANGELINAMDYDSFIFPTHAPPSVIPAPLALGETVGASGKDIILATALGCEISIRLAMSIRGLKKIFSTPEGSEVGKIVGLKNSVSAVGVVTIGGAAGAAKIMKLPPEKLAHALALSAHFTPFPQAKWRQTPRMWMTKYVSSGWVSLAEVTAVLLADMGYTSDPTFLDGDLGFWRFFGSDMWDPHALLGGMGKEWRILTTVTQKPYPCCGDFHVGLDCFIKIMKDHDLKPDEIEDVRIQTNPVVTHAMHMTHNITDHIVAQFSMPFSLAAAAFGVSFAEWQDPERINDPAIIAFQEKIHLEGHPKFLEVQAKEPGSIMTTCEVKTKRGTFVEEGKFARGFAASEKARLSDEELISKFEVDAGKVLPKAKMQKARDLLLNLEKVKNIAEVIKEVTP